jgi:hypothetical protein
LRYTKSVQRKFLNRSRLAFGAVCSAIYFACETSPGTPETHTTSTGDPQNSGEHDNTTFESVDPATSSNDTENNATEQVYFFAAEQVSANFSNDDIFWAPFQATGGPTSLNPLPAPGEVYGLYTRMTCDLSIDPNQILGREDLFAEISFAAPTTVTFVQMVSKTIEGPSCVTFRNAEGEWSPLAQMAVVSTNGDVQETIAAGRWSEVTGIVIFPGTNYPELLGIRYAVAP